MHENVAVVLKVRPCDRLAPRTIRIERSGPQHDVFAVESPVALANRHRRLSRVVPDSRKAIGFGVETGDSGASAAGSVRVEEREFRFQKPAAFDHLLPARALCDDRFSLFRKEGPHHVPIARKLREQLLSGTRRVRRLVLILALLRDRDTANEQEGENASPHSA